MTTDHLEITDRILILKDRETIFDALTLGDQLTRWWPKAARTDPRVGGILEFDWFVDAKFASRFDIVDRPDRVAYPFYAEYHAFAIHPESRGSLVTVTHSKIARNLDDVGEIIHIARNWGFLLANLKACLEHGVDLRT